MNDAMRGVVIVVSFVALFYAVRLTVVQVVDWVQNRRRRHVVMHAVRLTAGLALNAGLAIGTEMDNAGSNFGLEWKEWIRLAAHLLIASGLIPLWREHLRREDRKEDRGPAHA